MMKNMYPNVSYYHKNSDGIPVATPEREAAERRRRDEAAADEAWREAARREWPFGARRPASEARTVTAICAAIFADAAALDRWNDDPEESVRARFGRGEFGPSPEFVAAVVRGVEAWLDSRGLFPRNAAGRREWRGV